LHVMIPNLMDKIAVALQDMLSGEILPKEEAKTLVESIADKYGLDLNTLSPWEKVEGIAYPYNDPSEWGLLLSSMLDGFAGDVYLVVTNEEPFPWPVIVLSVDDVQALLLELPHFELFVFDDTMERVIVDTEQHELIVLEKQ
jgi:hypothetical protein